MSIIIHPDPVPLRVDESGTIRVGQSRITLDVLLDYFQQGASPEQLASAEYFPTLSLSDVHGALAYYHRHKAELDDYLRQRQVEADRLQKEIETANAPFLSQMKARLDAARTQRNAAHASPAE
jgi:uncharacterized protein (DUF433 family)